MQLVASLRSGREAIEQVERIDPDVVILDVDMPDTDGITALPRLLAKKRDLVVIMASTLTRRNAEISLRALSLGAADYIPKPETTREITGSDEFRRELIDKIRALGTRRKRRASEAPGAGCELTAPAPALAPHPLGSGLRHVTSPGIAPPGGPGRDQAAAVSGGAAARAAGGLLDRRAAGAQHLAQPTSTASSTRLRC